MEENSIAYRKGVGPENLYDVVAAHQFIVLVHQGLRDTHYVLDFGCGSLRLGRLLIPFLLPGRYHGIDADLDLIREGMANETGNELLALKRATVHVDPNFDCAVLKGRYDYIMFHSIFSHATKGQIGKALASARLVLNPKGIVLATFYRGNHDYEGAEWLYPYNVRYTEETMRRLVEGAGFQVVMLPRKHPTRQTWMKIAIR